MSSAFEVFDHLVNARDVKQLLNCYEKLNESLFLNECVNSFAYFARLKKCLQKSKQILKFNKISSILQKLDKRAQLKCYHQNQRLQGQRVLVIGGGISGLRVAIELLLLGANVICVEKRDTFSRNNVIHLWPNVICDLRLLAAKRFYGRFCVGSIDHIAIRQIQLILLKIALIYGLKFCPNVTFDKLCPKLLTQSDDNCDRNVCRCCCHSHGFGGGAVAHFTDSVSGEPLAEMNARSFDIIVGADGRRNTLFQDFPRKEFRGKLAIAITANFVNGRTEEEVRVAEISGVSYIYAQKWFKELLRATGVQLENVCYYRDETHYFVMTATKVSLLARGVLKQDLNETHLLLADENIDRKQLLSYARDAAHWTSGLRNLEFSLNASNSPDVALFDFTSVYASRNASRAKRVRLQCCQRESEFRHVLMLLTGDSLLEPFWPTGSGAGRGFLSALDAAFTALQWTEKVVKNDNEDDLHERMTDVIAERESVYRLLAQTTPENVNSKEFSLFPNQRYQNWRQNSKFEIRQQVRHLIGHTAPLETAPQPKPDPVSLAAKRARRATVAVTSRDLTPDPEKSEEREREREEEEECLEVKDDVARRQMRQKADWLLGDACGGGQRVERVPRHKKENIVERAQQLEQILGRENQFVGKLARVGKIDDNDWNFRVWNDNRAFKKEKKSETRQLPDNSKAILDSRKKQIQEKLNHELKDTPKDTPKDTTARARPQHHQWVQRMSEELTQRMTQKKLEPREPEPQRELESEQSRDSGRQEEKREKPLSTSMPCSMPRCVRCGLEVSAVERISVSGDVLHRSCLRCSKCGISLRLNEFRNELKFLCIYCLKNNTKVTDWTKAKEDFLRENQKIDFRERIEFENKEKELEIVEKLALNHNEDDDSELTFDLTSDSSPSLETTSSSEWETEEEDDEEENEEKEEPKPEEPIPSIRVTRVTRVNNDNHLDKEVARYSGAFTEKLFRSKSQPLLVARRLKAFPHEEEQQVDVYDEDSLFPFADLEGSGEQLLGVRGVRAPIIEFKDI